ncbi:HEAT repeat domain-containing protein [Hyalangium versicolor]|uniref:HEAT repeat domain-containing protein n=1 Tax=Hyalangium versicolor TaxID=2861190 RepID=UPI001CC98D43|nr:HEAT repeat domain-containing protein [Hyalangium versicolor]
MNEAIRELGQQLSSEDLYERETSALELAGLEDPQAAPFLVRALEDAEASVRRWGAHGLAKLGSAEHASALRKALEKDEDPRVRVQAAFGLAVLGERSALEKLPQYLSAEPPDARRDAAAMLGSLPENVPVRAVLKPLLGARDERGRAWAAALLHSLGEPDVFAKWHSALASPEGRRDAILAVPLMREARAVRELLRLLAELPPEELETAEGDEPTLVELLCDALRLSGLELLLDSDTDDALRADLLVLMGRHRELIPDLASDIVEAFTQRPADKLGQELAELLLEREPEERGAFFTNVAPLFPKSALPALAELKGPEREAVLRHVAQAALEAQGENAALSALCQELRATPYGHHFEGLPTSPTARAQEFPEDEDDWSGETQEQAIPDEEEIYVEGGTLEEDEESWTEQVAPEADAVAQRALVLGGLLRRLALEERLAKGKDPAAKEEILRLQKWMDEEGLFNTLGVTGMELLEVEPGIWSTDERQMVSWSAEELQLLLWALKQGKLTPAEARAEAAPLLERVPLLKDPQPFLESAERRPLEEVQAQRDRWEAMLECARHESFARGIVADPSLAEEDPDLETLLESAEEVGFDRKGLSANQSKAHVAAEGLRHWSRHLVNELQEQGLLPGKAGEGLVFQGKRLPDLDEAALDLLLALAHGRFHALEWLVAGGEPLPEGEEEEAG